ncbi:TetR family transcriptional regulator [Oxalobacter vibrioformis]|uniref:TetR family transcriptional regulator n=1 Tax=Oxalobacter vibrioformis TaxID=933080 RepID=A0A9E9LYB8_9BURK|nr:TetR family transcriptional regulator [Oxalobacter vibrioformis]WAW09468.1 TetR family transcriptional regulator [Oxalobacter vibrioformis]
MTRAARKKTQETRDRLLDAAERVFNEKGVSNTTLNDIAEAAGVTRGAIYWHFRNKVDLFNAMIDRVRLPIRAMIEEIADEKTEDPLGRLREKSIFLMREILENDHYRKVMTILFHKCEYTDSASEFLEYFQDWTTRARGTLVRVLTNAREKKQLPQDIDIDLAGLTLHVAFNGLLNSWLLMPESFDLLTDSSRVFEAVFSMLRHSPHMRVVGERP